MAELYRPDLRNELLSMVNEPIVFSLLYDADLLPEQLSSQKNLTIGLFAAYNRLEGILLAFKYLKSQGVNFDIAQDDQGLPTHNLSK